MRRDDLAARMHHVAGLLVVVGVMAWVAGQIIIKIAGGEGFGG